MKIIIYILSIVILLVSCDIFDSDENNFQFDDIVYIALQKLDKVGIIHVQSDSIQEISTKYNSINCSDYESESECIEINNCIWHPMGSFSHCMMDNDICLNYGDEESCIKYDDCEWHQNMNHCMETGSLMDMGENTPHFIKIDNVNRYWFVTTITSGFVGRYNLDTNELIDRIFIGDSPALMVLNEFNQTLYVSRMMPMAGMMTGSTSTKIQEIDYSNNLNMQISNEFEVNSPAPHGIAINSDGSEIYVVSNTADWLWKINTLNGIMENASLDSSVSQVSITEIHRLKPLQVISIKDSLLFITCSGGSWYNPSNGNNNKIQGQIQMWNSNLMKLVDIFYFNWYSSPWHIVASDISNEVFVSLAGDKAYSIENNNASAGAACLTYGENGFNDSPKWTNYSKEFEIIHGIDYGNNGTIYLSGRGDDKLHIINQLTGDYIKFIKLPNSSLAGGIQVYRP